MRILLAPPSVDGGSLGAAPVIGSRSLNALQHEATRLVLISFGLMPVVTQKNVQAITTAAHNVPAPRPANSRLADGQRSRGGAGEGVPMSPEAEPISLSVLATRTLLA